jgi:hypothetical protein
MGGLPVIHLNTLTTCNALVTDPLDPSIQPTGTILLDTSARGGDPGVGYFWLGGVQQGQQSGLVCTLTGIPTGGSTCTFGYLPTFSGRMEMGYLQAHHLRATYNPIAGNGLFSTSYTIDLRVRRLVFTYVVSCSPAAAFVGVPLTCYAKVEDKDTGAGVTPIGKLTWSENAPLLPLTFASGIDNCDVDQVVLSCPVTFTPGAPGAYSLDVTFTPSPADLYHSEWFLSSGYFPLNVSANSTVTNNVQCTPNTTPVSSTVTCSADVENKTGSTLPSGNLTWTFSPPNSPYAAHPCTSLSATMIRCSVDYTALTPGPVTLTVQFTGNPGYGSSNSGAPAPVLTVT